jgi:DNA-binding transcriptional MerR regulator
VGPTVDKAPDAFRTISEVADDLNVPQHVLRFWETRFPQIKPMKRGGGRRYYRPDDVDLLRGIRHLLYGEGYTIRGVQRLLKDNGPKFVQAVWKPEAVTPAPDVSDTDGDEEVVDVSADDVADEEVAERDATEDERNGAEIALGHLPAPERIAEPSAKTIQPRSRATPLAKGRDEPQPAVAVPEPSAIVPAESPPAPAPSAGLSAEDRRRLQAALYELGECRRLIEVALKEE